MKLDVFSVYDVKAQAYLPPFFMSNNQVAIRAITDCVNDPSHLFYKNPQDYTLFFLGVFDDNTGLIEPHIAPITLGNGVEFVKPVTIKEVV